MTSVNVTTTKNTVTVNGETRVVTVKTQGPQGPAFSDGDKGDVTVSSNGTAISINSNAITSAKIADGAIVDADINASAAIALSKLATGALPTAITVTSANISDLSIVDADISGSAAISLSKLATGALPTAITVTSANISDLSIVNADINASAAIAGTKISPDFGSQNIVTTGTGATGALGVTGNITVSGTVDGVDVATRDALFGGLTSSSGVLSNGVTATTQSASDNSTKVATTAYTDTAISNLINGAPAALDTLNELAAALNDDAAFSTTVTNSIATKMPLAGGQFTGNITFSGTQTVDGRDLSVDGAKLDGIESGATADQTASEILTLIKTVDGAGSGLDADTLDGLTSDSFLRADANDTTVGNLTISNTHPRIFLTDTNNNSDYKIQNQDGTFTIRDETNSAHRLRISSNGVVEVFQQLDAEGGLNVTGNITVTGTVDGRDVATDGTKLDGIETGATADQTASEIKTAYESNSDTNAFTDALLSKLNGIESNATADQTKADIDSLGIAASTAATLLNARTIAGTSFDGSANIDISYTNLTNKLSVGDGGLTQNNFTNALKTKLDGIETAATADQTAAEIKTLLDSNGIVNSNVDANAAIAGTKISPNFGSQNITTTGTLSTQGTLTIGGTFAQIFLQDSNDNPDYRVQNSNGTFIIKDHTNNVNRFRIGTDGNVRITNGLEAESGLDVTGNISVTGTVDGVDIAARDTLFGGLTSSSGVLTNGVTATTQSASDNSTKVATTAYTDTAIANLVDSAPGTLNTLNELASALGDDANFSTTVTNSIATKMPLAGGTFTGNVTYGNDVMAVFGTGGSAGLLEIKASANGNCSITEKGGGDLTIQATQNAIFFQHAGTSEYLAVMKTDAEVELYYNGNQKFETTNVGVTVTGNISVSGTVDGRDIATDGTKLDGIESNATADQTASEIVALVADQTIAPSEIDMEDNEKIKLGTGDDLEIYHTSTTSHIDNNTGSLVLRNNVGGGSSAIQIQAKSGEFSINAFPDAAVDLYYDNSKKFETTSSGVTLNDGLILDNATNAGRDVQWQPTNDRLAFFDNTKATFGNGADLEIYHNGSHSIIQETGTGDLELCSNTRIMLQKDRTEALAKFIPDGAVELYYDNVKKLDTQATSVRLFDDLVMSANNILLNDNAQIQIGNAPDLRIYHDGSHSFITNTTGDLTLVDESRIKLRTDQFVLNNHANDESIIYAAADGEVSLYHNGSKKFDTTSGGISVTGNIAVSGTVDGVDVAVLSASVSGFLSNIVEDTSPELGGDLDVNGKKIKFPDLTGSVNNILYFGTGDDLLIYHHADVNYIQCENARTLRIQHFSGGNETLANFIPNGAVELYHDNSKKFETTSTGATISGNLQFNDNNKAVFGSGTDLLIYHDGSNSVIRSGGTGQLQIESSNNTNIVMGNAALSETIFKGIVNGAVELYYDNSKRFETSGDGAIITGPTSTTCALKVVGGEGHSAEVQLKADEGDDNADTCRLHQSINGNFYLQNFAAGSYESYLVAVPNGAVELYHDNVKKFSTTSDGAQLDGSGSSCNLTIRNGTASASNGGNITFKNTDGNGQPRDVVRIKGFTGGSTGGYGELTLQTAFNNTLNDCLVIKKDKNIELPNDNQRLQIGAGQDLQIYHDGSNSFLTNATGYLLVNSTSGDNVIRSSNNVFLQPASGESGVTANANGSVELYYDNSKQFETTADGVNVQGHITLAASNNAPKITFDENGANDPKAEIQMDQVDGSNGHLILKTEGSGTLTERMRIASDGNVAIGNTDAQQLLHVWPDTANTTSSYIRVTAGDRGSGTGLDLGHDSSGNCHVNAVSNAHLILSSNNTERMRVANDGDVSIGTTNTTHKFTVVNDTIQQVGQFLAGSTSYDETVLQAACSRNVTNGSYNHFKCSINGVADKMRVRDSGNVQNTNNSYGSLSDERLKENIVDATSQWNDIKNIRVRKFNFKEGVDPAKPTLLGVIAQEAELVCPNLIETDVQLQAGEEKEYKSFKYSVLYMKAIKCLQEAMAKIEVLETKVATLEGG